MTIKIVVTQKPDLAAIAAIHNACFDKAWNAEAIAGMLAVKGTAAFIAENNEGFGLLRHLGDDAEILTLAVIPGQRRGGIAHGIVCAMLEWAKGEGAKAVFLEVGKRNEAARKLYEKNGFSVISTRREYYRREDGVTEHALVMRRSLL